jgi:hypothetical protein
MADADIQITAGSGTKVDTRTVGGGEDEHRQVMVVGDPVTAANVASVSPFGAQYVMGGSLGVVTTRHTNITTAVSNTQLGPTISGSQRLIVTRITVTLDSASTVFPTVLIGFAAATTPTGDGVIAYHGGLPAGGGFTIGDGSGVIGVGAVDEELRITTTGNATGNGVSVSFSYIIIAA